MSKHCNTSISLLAVMSLNLLLALASHHTYHKSDTHMHRNTPRDTHIAACSCRAYDEEQSGEGL